MEKLLIRACKVDIHFSLKYYFYMKSLEIMEVGDAEIRKFERVIEYNSKFRTMINHYYRPNKLKEFALSQQESLIVENNTFSETD